VRYLSVCSGIEAATVAWHPLGWSAAAFSDIEAFPRAVLKHHYPGVECHGDFTTISETDYGPVDLLVGGTPCQDFSVAGLRAGAAGDRGNLTLQFLRLAARKRPQWIVWENVPGVLSVDGGRTFGAVLGGLAQLGYGFAYRILDAQHFGLAQRRARVFVVGYLGDWRRAAAVLFERESLRWDTAPRRSSGERTPGAIGARSCLSVGAQDADAGHLIASTGDPAFTLDTTGAGAVVGAVVTRVGDGSGQNAYTGHLIASTGDIAPGLNAGGMGRQDFETETVIAHALRGEGFDASRHRNQRRGVPLVPMPFDTTQITSPANYSRPRPGDPCHPLAAGAPPPAVAFDLRGREGGAQFEGPHDTANIRAADGGSSRSYVAASGVRRLTVRECERLQGFPDDYTLVPYRGRPAADGPRYKSLGNSMAVPVMSWIGRRIAMVEAMT